VICCYECGNETFGSIKCENLLSSSGSEGGGGLVIPVLCTYLLVTDVCDGVPVGCPKTVFFNNNQQNFDSRSVL